jgi:hypothetical protein
VPPETVDVKASEAPTAPVVGPPTITTNAVEEIETRWKVEAVLPLWSVTVRVTLYVPLTAKVEENVEAVPDAGLPPVTAQA